MKTKIILVIAAGVALVSSCKFFGVGEGAKNGSIWGDQIEASEVLETRSIVVPGFNGLDVGMACKVEYVPGDCRLEVETHENLFDHLKFEVDSAGVLRISQDNYNVRNMNTMNIYVQSPSLVKTNLSGAARFSAAGGIEAETFDLSISGAGDVSIDGLDAASVEMTLSGACKLNLQGLDSQEFSIGPRLPGVQHLHRRGGRRRDLRKDRQCRREHQRSRQARPARARGRRTHHFGERSGQHPEAEELRIQLNHRGA